MIDVHSVLAFASGLNRVTVHVDNCRFKEFLRLASPHGAAYLINGVMQCINVGLRSDSTAEVSGSCGIGNASRANEIEVRFIILLQLKILQASSIGERVVGDVKHMIGFVMWKIILQQSESPIDGINETALMSKRMNQPQSAITCGSRSIRDFKPDRARGHHRYRVIIHLMFVLFGDPTLSFGELL